MEQYLYTALSGATHTLTSQRVHANNLANVDTTGFRADMANQQAYQVLGDGFADDFAAQEAPTVTRFTPGRLQETGRDLDVGIQGHGFLSVLDAQGNEAYTRAGNIQVGANGELTIHGQPVLGTNGPIAVPEYATITVGEDGTISTVPLGGNATIEVGQLKLVNPDTQQLHKGVDGLFRQQDGTQAEQADDVTVIAEHLEMSNVNAIDEMVSTMSASRTFEMQVKMMETADDLADAGNRLVRGS